MPPSCTLLVYFEKPPVSSAAWGHVVAAGLCSREGHQAGPCPSLAPHPQPFPSTWPEPPHPDSQLRHHSLGQEGQRSGVQRGLWWGGLVTCWQYGESGKLGLAPPLSGLSPCPPRPLLLQAWPLAAVSIIRAPAAVITARVERWVESSVVPYTASSRVTSGARRETQPPRMLALPGSRTVPWLAAGWS